MEVIVSSDPEHGICPSCGAEAGGTYCATCGRRWSTTIPTIRDFAHEVSEEFGGLGARFLRTLSAVMLHPGWVTSEYAGGRGAMYVAPVRFYLTIAVGYIALSAWLPVSPPFIGALGFLAGDAFLQTWLPRVLIFAVPVLAGLFKALYPRIPFVRHLVFSLYLHAMFYASNGVYEGWAQLAQSTPTPAPPGGTLVLTVWHLVYLFFGLRRIGGGVVRPAFSTMGAGVGYAVTYALMVLGMVQLSPQLVDDLIAQSGAAVPEAPIESVSEADVRRARSAFNEAIASRDLDVIDGLLLPTYHVVTGRSVQAEGHDANVSLWQNMFATDSIAFYIRSPREVRVNEAFGLAEELGDWSGRYLVDGRLGEASGVYAAKWQRTTDGSWLLQSEVFTTLMCSGGSEVCRPPDPVGR